MHINTRISIAAAALMLASFSAQAASHSGMPAAKSPAASGAIAAGEGPAKIAVPQAGVTTRAEVKADAKRAVEAGTVRKGEGSAPIRKTTDGNTTRAEVKAEAAAAVKSGEIAKGPNVPAAGGVAKP